MPIKIPSNLPAYDVLRREGVMVMAEDTAARQDIRPLKIGLLITEDDGRAYSKPIVQGAYVCSWSPQHIVGESRE